DNMGVFDMKSQDFLVLIKLISLQKEELRKIHYPLLKQSHFETNDNYSICSDISLSELYTLRTALCNKAVLTQLA
ncbi:hypothetical protein, partial [Acinetobacter towneri]|uniref:hypothetical protein n=1 Tax=Acinetobacter towneri TaxID=202956 RepID=UPI0032154EFD